MQCHFSNCWFSESPKLLQWKGKNGGYQVSPQPASWWNYKERLLNFGVLLFSLSRRSEVDQHCFFNPLQTNCSKAKTIIMCSSFTSYTECIRAWIKRFVLRRWAQLMLFFSPVLFQQQSVVANDTFCKTWNEVKNNHSEKLRDETRRGKARVMCNYDNSLRTSCPKAMCFRLVSSCKSSTGIFFTLF